MISQVLNECLTLVKVKCHLSDADIAYATGYNNSYIHRIRTSPDSNPTVKALEQILSVLEEYHPGIRVYFYQRLLELETGVRHDRQKSFTRFSRLSLDIAISELLPIDKAIETVQELTKDYEDAVSSLEAEKLEIEAIQSRLYNCMSTVQTDLRRIGLRQNSGYNSTDLPKGVNTVPILNNAELRRLRLVLRAMQNESEWGNEELRKYLGLSEPVFIELFIGLENIKKGIEEAVSFEWVSNLLADQFAQKIRLVTGWEQDTPLFTQTGYYQDFNQLKRSLRNGDRNEARSF